jgi:acetyl-CoA synthetase
LPDPAGSTGSGLVFDDPLDRPSADDTDRGWGGSLSGAAEDDFTRFLDEKPPHHI